MLLYPLTAKTVTLGIILMSCLWLIHHLVLTGKKKKKDIPGNTAHWNR